MRVAFTTCSLNLQQSDFNIFKSMGEKWCLIITVCIALVTDELSIFHMFMHNLHFPFVKCLLLGSEFFFLIDKSSLYQYILEFYISYMCCIYFLPICGLFFFFFYLDSFSLRKEKIKTKLNKQKRKLYYTCQKLNIILGNNNQIFGSTAIVYIILGYIF